jgi:hypothetical protein
MTAQATMEYFMLQLKQQLQGNGVFYVAHVEML